MLKELTSGNKVAVSFHLSKFKERGIIAFDKIFAISNAERIPGLVKTQQGRMEVLVALTASLKSAFNNMNLRFGANEDQIIELADQIIDQSHEDNLSLEDVLLFLQKLLLSEWGKLYDRMDMPKFFEQFEVYRQERHAAHTAISDEKHTNYKAMGMERQGNITWGDLLHKTANLKQ